MRVLPTSSQGLGILPSGIWMGWFIPDVTLQCPSGTHTRLQCPSGTHTHLYLQDGRTALHYAASWASHNAVTALLAASASHSTLDNSGRTPLHLAVNAPVTDLDQHVKEELVRQGRSLVSSNNM